MATRTVRARQRAEATTRLTDVAGRLSDLMPDIGALDMPTFHREPDYLLTLQLDAVSGWLESLEGALKPEPSRGVEKGGEKSPDPEPDAPKAATAKKRM